MPESFSRTFHVRWGDLDYNGHMRNTAYLDVGADVRMMFFEQHGFSMREFERLRIGPVMFRDELEYFREMRLLERFDVALEIAGVSDDHKHFRLRNEFIRADGVVAARVSSNGAWFDLESRKIVAPPSQLIATFSHLPRSGDFTPIVRSTAP